MAPPAWRSRPGPAAVVEFHTAHKFLLLAHSPAAYARLGRLVADPAGPPRARWLDAYGRAFMEALTARTTIKKHVNVLQHVIGFFNHHVARFDVAYVRDQTYLRPHPKELMLRNHV